MCNYKALLNFQAWLPVLDSDHGKCNVNKDGKSISGKEMQQEGIGYGESQATDSPMEYSTSLSGNLTSILEKC